MKTRKANGGSFRKGDDPRRHEFSTAERRRGFRNAVKSRGPMFIAWLRNRVAMTARPETVSRYKARWLACRAGG